MPTYRIPISQERAEALVERTPEQVQDYLTGRGLIVDGISTSLDPPSIRIEADRDPTPHLALLQQWPQKRDHAAGRAAMKTFMQKVNAGQAPTNLEILQAIRGIIIELARD